MQAKRNEELICSLLPISPFPPSLPQLLVLSIALVVWDTPLGQLSWLCPLHVHPKLLAGTAV